MNAEIIPERVISAEAVHSLGLVALEAEPKEKMGAVYEKLGSNLNLAEVATIAHALIDEYSNPDIKESRVVRVSIYTLGRHALSIGDADTANSAMQYLRHATENRLSHIYGRVLAHKIKRQNKGS